MGHRFSGISGAQSRQWRKSVALVAKSRKSYVRTIKYPLELHFSDPLDFDSISELFETTEGTSANTLFGILTATHLAGFRLFANARLNSTFRSIGELEREFSQAWKEQSETAPKLCPSMLIEFVKTPRRNVRGRTKPFDEETVFADFALRCGLTAADRARESNELSFFRGYIQTITRTFSSWVDMNNHADQGLAIFDSKASEYDVELPSIASAVQNTPELAPPDSSIAFDENLLTLDQLEVSEISLHQVVAQKLRMLRGDGVESPKPADLQAVITTNTNNALSWLFGTGFSYWRDTELAQIHEDFAVPEAATPRIAVLKEIFEETPRDRLFGLQNYATFRSSVGGKLDSWVANYVAQLLKIEEALNSFESWVPNTELSKERATRYFRSLGGTYDDLVESIASAERKKAKAEAALSLLLGKGDELPAVEHVAQIEDFSRSISSISGSLESIKNAIEQDLESDSADNRTLAKLCQFSVPSWLKPLPRVNQISGGTPEIEEELTTLSNDFIVVRELREEFASDIVERAASESALSDYLAADAAREQELLDQRNMPGATADSQSRRRALGRLCGIGKTGSVFLKNILQTSISRLFVNKKDLRRLLNSGQGSVYVSPFSTGRHQPLQLIDDELACFSIEDTLGALIAALEHQVLQSKAFVEFRDLLRLEDLAATLSLSRLPERIPSEWLNTERLTETASVPDYLQPLLEAPQLTRQTVIKLNNLMTVQLNGLLAKGFRKNFYVRTKFMRVGVNELQWVPKSGRLWTPPPHVEGSNGTLGDSIRFVREKTENPDAPLDPATAAKTVLDVQGSDPLRASGVAPLLQQLPHDWYVDLAISGMTSDFSGFGVDKNRIRRISRQLSSPARLVGASASKNNLDQWLCDSDVKIGEHNILFEQHYEQRIELDENLNPTFSAKALEVKAELALTITDDRQPQARAHPIADTVIGIDLGEAGIGYAVFRTEEIHRAVAEGEAPDPIESGSIPVRSVRDLIKRVKRHRSTIQPNQRFRQGSSTALKKLREGALGDVTFAIDALCQKHKGFPVLETSVVNLASGGKQLQLIYDKIVHTYFWSDVDAHKASRRHHWAGAENWEHPTLGETERRQGPDGMWAPTGPRRQLKLYPGSAVHPAGTSQVCSACKRNPFKSIEDSVADNGETTFRLKDSRVELASGDQFLILSSVDHTKSSAESAAESKRFRRLKERAPNQYAVAERNVDQRELKRMIKRQLRHGQRSTRSKDTTQSAYSCVFADCGNDMHADENAAINIVRKWVSDRGIH